MANTIILKQSSTAAKVPLSGDLDLGELALNTTDGKVYMKLGTNTVVDIVDHTAASSGADIKVAYEAEANTNAYTDADLAKLAAIEASATADQTGAEIKTAYEAEANTNAYTDAEVSKLAAIEASATADQTGAEIKSAYEAEANAFTDAQFTKLSGVETSATADQTKADIEGLSIAFSSLSAVPTTIVGYGLTDAYTKAEIEARDAAIISGIDWKEAVATFADLATTHTSPVEGWTASVNDVDTVYRYDGSTWVVLANGTVPLATAVIDGKLSSADFTKLAGIEANATADQTGAEIKTLYQAQANAFTDAQFTKLSGVETSATADQTQSDINALSITATSCSGNSATATTSSACSGNAATATTASNATSLGGVASTSYLRSNLADAMTGGSLTFNDNIELYIGTGNDITHVYDGVNYNTDVKGQWIVTDGNASSETRYTFSTGTGDFTATGNVTAYSDERIKTNIETIQNALEKVSQVNGVTYDRTDIDADRQTGVIAQELQKVLPEAVQENADGLLSVAYGNVIGLLIEAIKELKAEVEELKAK